MGSDDADPTVRRRAERGPGAEDVAPEYRVRARFYAIRQVDGEPAYDWYRRVRAAAVPCRFDGRGHQAAVADKFVTGLRPGPVADRLLGERADRPPEDLLAVAVAAEQLARGRRRAVAGADRAASSVAAAPPADGGDCRDALIDEIREGLKLYRYSGEGYGRPPRRASSDDDANNNGFNNKPGPSENESNNMKLKFNENSYWKNRIEKKSKQYGNTVNYYNLS